MIAYKLVDQQMQSYGGFQWTIGETYTANGKGQLCGSGWLHFYEHPLLAVLHNPIHARIENPILLEVDIPDNANILREGYLKLGATIATPCRRVELPSITTAQHIAYGLLVVLTVSQNADFKAWAESWLDGSGRGDIEALRMLGKFESDTSESATLGAERIITWTAAYLSEHTPCNVGMTIAHVPRQSLDLNLIYMAQKALEY
jgi:hypothetical protein